MLELATSLPAMRTIRHQPRGLRQRTCTTLKKAATTSHELPSPMVKRRDSESLQAELAAAWWALLGPTLLVRAYDGGEHADNDGLTLEQRRKLSTDLARKRAALATMLSREVDARVDGTLSMQQSTTLKADTMRAPDGLL